MRDPWRLIVPAILTLLSKKIIIKYFFAIDVRSSLQFSQLISCFDSLEVAPQAHKDDKVGEFDLGFLFVVVLDEGVKLLNKSSLTVV